MNIEITQNQNLFIVCGQNTQGVFKFLVKQLKEPSILGASRGGGCEAGEVRLAGRESHEKGSSSRMQ